MRKLATVATLLIVCLFVLGASCQKRPVDVTGQTLMALGVSYSSTMETLGDLYKAGLLTRADVEKIAEVAGPFKDAYNAALDLYVVWLRTESAADEQRLMIAISEAVAALSKLKDYVIPYLEKGGKK